MSGTFFETGAPIGGPARDHTLPDLSTKARKIGIMGQRRSQGLVRDACFEATSKNLVMLRESLASSTYRIKGAARRVPFNPLFGEYWIARSEPGDDTNARAAQGKTCHPSICRPRRRTCLWSGPAMPPC